MNKSSSSARKSNRQNKSRLEELFPTMQGQREVSALRLIDRKNLQSENQVRSDPAAANIGDLRESIAEAKRRNLGIEGTGILQPLLVEPIPNQPGRFKIIAGERRWRASETVTEEVPCVVVASNAQATQYMQLVENIQRENLSPLDEARAVAQMKEETGMSIRDLAAMLGKGKNWVDDRVQIFSVNEKDPQTAIAAQEAQDLLSRHRDKPGATLTNAVYIKRARDPILRGRLLHAAMTGASEAHLRAILDAHKRHAEQIAAEENGGQSAASDPVGDVASGVASDSFQRSATASGTPVVPTGFNRVPSDVFPQGRPSVADSVAAIKPTAVPPSQRPDVVEEFLWPANSLLARGVNLLESGEAKVPFPADLAAAMDAIDEHIQRLRQQQQAEDSTSNNPS